jgi:hypothetical protein
MDAGALKYSAAGADIKKKQLAGFEPAGLGRQGQSAPGMDAGAGGSDGKRCRAAAGRRRQTEAALLFRVACNFVKPQPNQQFLSKA